MHNTLTGAGVLQTVCQRDVTEFHRLGSGHPE